MTLSQTSAVFGGLDNFKDYSSDFLQTMPQFRGAWWFPGRRRFGVLEEDTTEGMLMPT